jgi:hypothetical protein
MPTVSANGGSFGFRGLATNTEDHASSMRCPDWSDSAQLVLVQSRLWCRRILCSKTMPCVVVCSSGHFIMYGTQACENCSKTRSCWPNETANLNLARPLLRGAPNGGEGADTISKFRPCWLQYIGTCPREVTLIGDELIGVC